MKIMILECEVLFTCSGIAVQREGHVIRFLTSASLAKTLINERKHHDNLKVGAGSHPFFFLCKL